MGNFRDDYLARGVHDPLLAKAIVFADSAGTKTALLTLDVCMLDRRNVAFIREIVGSQCGVQPENVMVHATHTHSAPAPSDRFLFGLDFAPYRGRVDALLAKAASAVAAAERDLAEATLSVGRAAEHRVSFNRRLRRSDGSTQMNWEALSPGFDPADIDEPWGPVDPELLCMVVERNERPIAALVNFGLHPAILAGDNWLYSADFPGSLAEGLRRIRGNDFTSIFLNGCSGNVNHVDYRQPGQGRGFQMVQRVGTMLAVAAAKAIRAATPVDVDCVQVSSDKATLERIQIDETERRRCLAVLEEARRRPPQGQVDGLPEAFFAELRLAMHEMQDRPDEVEVMAIRLGDAALVGLPGENFCESGLDVKRLSPARHTLVAGLSNDAIGYLPTRESFAQGGYETTVGSTLYEEDAAERLVASAVSQLNRLFGA
jgi:hypothetical protein